MRVLIVGGAGFLGGELATRFVADGFDTVVLDTAPRLAHRLPVPGVDALAFDFVGDAGRVALPAADALVHLGCTTNPALSMRDLPYDAESNIGPSLRLFDAAAAAGIGRVVFASSGGTVYGAPRRLPVHEDDAPAPLSGYGVSKWAIERYLALNDRVRGVSLRVSNPYGPRQLGGAAVGVIARYVGCVARGEPLQVWGDGRIVRDYIAVEDVAAAFATAVARPSFAHASYNIGSGEGRSINEIIEAVFAAAGRRVPVDYQPGRAYDVPEIVLDSARFVDETGWSPRISLAEGVGRLWEHARRDVAGG